MRNALAELASELAEVELEGVPAYLPSGDDGDVGDDEGERLDDDARDALHLLPYFDPHVVGCHPRSHLFPGEAAARALTRGQAGTRPVLLLGGTVAGIRHQKSAGKSVHVTVEPFVDLSARHRGQLVTEVERVGEVLEAPTTRLPAGRVMRVDVLPCPLPPVATFSVCPKGWPPGSVPASARALPSTRSVTRGDGRSSP